MNMLRQLPETFNAMEGVLAEHVYFLELQVWLKLSLSHMINVAASAV